VAVWVEHVAEKCCKFVRQLAGVLVEQLERSHTATEGRRACSDWVGHALADLLDALGDDVAGLDEAVRWQARESCRVLLGEQMASATTRRTRRR
jgi:hypothetical protein